MSIKVKTIQVTVTVTLEQHESTDAVITRLESAVDDIGESCEMVSGSVDLTSERSHSIEVE